MSLHPSGLSNRPTLEDSSADALSDVLLTSRLSSVIYKRLHLGAPWGMRWPAFPNVRFYVVARGGGLLKIKGEPEIALSAGDVALVAHGDSHVFRDSATTKPWDMKQTQHCHESGVHSWGGKGPETVLVAGYFKIRSAENSAFFTGLPRVVYLPGGKDEAISATVQLIIREVTGRGPGSSVVLGRLADVLLVHAVRSLAARTDVHVRGASALADPPIRSALGLMHARIAEAWTVESLAREVALSRSGFAARFTERVGEPPLAYLTRWRMAKAAQLLRDTEETMAAIASAVGYESGPAFNKAFKRWEGIGPGAYRRQHAR